MFHIPWFDFIDMLLAMVLGVQLPLIYLAIRERKGIEAAIYFVCIVALILLLLNRAITGARA